MKFINKILLGVLIITLVSVSLIFFTKIDHVVIAMSDAGSILMFVILMGIYGIKKRKLSWR